MAQTPQQGKRGLQPHPSSSQHCWHCCPEQLGHSLPSPSLTSRTLPQATAQPHSVGNYLPHPTGWKENSFVEKHNKSRKQSFQRQKICLWCSSFPHVFAPLFSHIPMLKFTVFQEKNLPKTKCVYLKRRGLKAPPLEISPLQRIGNLSGSTPARKESKPGAPLLQGTLSSELQLELHE